MTAIALSPNRRYIAIAEKGEKPTVTVFDMLHDQSKKRKVSRNIFYLTCIELCVAMCGIDCTIYCMISLQTLTCPELQTHEFVSLSFSPDSKYLIAQGGRPDWTLVYWVWEKSKVMATMKTTNQAGQPVQQVNQ